MPNWAPQEYSKVNVFGIERADGGAGLPRVHTKAPLPELVLADPPGIEQGHPRDDHAQRGEYHTE